jgi:polysaccharide biosynthesis transport protein
MIPGIKKRVFNLHDVIMYVAIARKHIRLMALLMVLSLTAGLVFYIYAKPVYYSKALVSVDYLALPVDTDKIYRDGRIRGVIRQLTAPHIRERTALALGVKAGASEIALDHVRKISATLTAEQNLEIEVWPTDKEWAAKWTETMVNEFLKYRRDRRMEENEQMLRGYREELDLLTSKIDTKIDQKADFSAKKDVTKSLIVLNAIKNLPMELTRINQRLDEMGRIRIRLQDVDLDVVSKLAMISASERNADSQLNVGQTVNASGDGANAADGNRASVVVLPSMIKPLEPWETLARDEQQLKAKVAEAARVYLPGHRKMIELSTELEDIERKLKSEYQVAQNRFDLEYQELINKKRDLESKLPEYQSISKEHEKLVQQSTFLTSGDLPYKNYADQLGKKISAVDFGGEKERVDLTYLGLTEYRDTPVSPSRMRLLLFALAGGGVLALGVPFLIEYLDHTLTNLEQVESAFQLRGLGIVPMLESSEPSALISTDEHAKNSLIENFRVIRTNVLSMGSLTKAPHVTMVSSAMPKEGKTVVSTNLAISFSQTGARTLLIDTDLRRGRLHRLFGYRKSPGLSNVLLGEVSLEEACRPTNHENLTILSAGRHMDTGTEMLGSASFAELMTTLRGRYDRIVMDTPPVLGLSETSIMQSLVDGVLFVIWSGHTPIRNMKAAIEMLQANGANFYGFVLNRLDLSATQNYYQYYYYSHDYYYHRQALENA